MSGTTSQPNTGAGGGRQGQLTRLYDTAFDRAPDSGGLAFWVNALNGAATLDTVADVFAASAEFRGRGESTLSDRDFVSVLYRNAFEREADAAGLNFWTSGLQRGAIDRGGVALALSESPEGLASLTPSAAGPDTYNDDNPNGLNSDGWRTVLFDGFNGDSLDRDNWPVLYGGGGGGAGVAQWSHDDVRVGDGKAIISMTNHGGWWTAGGFSQGWEGQTYGRFEVYAKIDHGQGTGGGILLWPSDNSYPPEIDMLETPEGDRSRAHFTHHWDGDGAGHFENRSFGVDVSQWHTYAVDWRPGWLAYYIDGQEMYSTTSNVPDEPMALSFMSYVAYPEEYWYRGGPDGSTPWQVNLHIDWARISASDGRVA